LKFLYIDASFDRLLEEIRRSKNSLEYEYFSAPRQTKNDIWTILIYFNDDVTAYTDNLNSKSLFMTDSELSSLWVSKFLKDVL
jgi:hypothetical protein